MHNRLPRAQQCTYPHTHLWDEPCPQSQAENLTLPVCDFWPIAHTDWGQFEFKMITDITTGICLPWYISTRGATSLHNTYFSLPSFHQWVQTQQPVLPVWPRWQHPHLLNKSYKTCHVAIFFGSPLDATCASTDTVKRALFNAHKVSLPNRNTVLSTWFVVHFFLF